MYSKSILIAMIACGLLASCSFHAPWRNEPIGQEVNVALTLRDNLLELPSVTVDGVPGRFLLGVANVRTTLDPSYLQRLQPSTMHSLELNARQSLRFTPVAIDLHGLADGIIGADVWKAYAITIDYRSGLLTLQREGIHPELMTITRFAAEPEVDLTIDGTATRAVLDTASPDTVVLPQPAAAPSRRSARIALAGTSFGEVDIRLADVARPRIGNRLLSKFLVTIDYGRKEVGLWRDPRIR